MTPQQQFQQTTLPSLTCVSHLSVRDEPIQGRLKTALQGIFAGDNIECIAWSGLPFFKH
jgi:hypothetical protein